MKYMTITPPEMQNRHLEYFNEFLRNLNNYDYKLKCYLDQNSNITEKMRAILVDWLIDVHRKFKLREETLFNTCSILDHFLSLETSITKNSLQLVGVTCMLIASKFEEMRPPFS
jgi:hypothetical protein